MTAPNTGAPEWSASQATPWLTINRSIRIFDAFGCFACIEDRDLNAPPGSCADGACYLVKATATGAWATHDGELAIALGTDAANGWEFVLVEREGVELWVRDENVKIRYNGSWASGGSSIAALEDVSLTGLADGYVLKYDASNGLWYPAPDVGQSGAVALEIPDTSYDLLAEHVGRYMRFTNAAAKTVNVRLDGSHALPANGEWHFRNAGAGDLTLVEVSAEVEIEPPAEGSLVIPYGGTATLKRWQTNRFDLIGVTAALISD